MVAIKTGIPVRTLAERDSMMVMREVNESGTWMVGWDGGMDDDADGSMGDDAVRDVTCLVSLSVREERDDVSCG